MLYGGIEAGGTKFVCAVCDDDLDMKERMSIPTSTPEETMSKVFAFFDQYQVQSIGVGSFGPIDVNEMSATYGYITTTPKLAWVNYDFVGALKKRYEVPIVWTTDVNAAAYGEFKKGAARTKKSCLYLTVGTGIGGGAVLNGNIFHGYGHPEMGHILVRKHPQDNFDGICPYHYNCLEGVASGPSLEKRYGVKAQDLSPTHQAWEIEAYYLAQAIMNYTLVLSPEIILLGGGVMKQTQIFSLIRTSFVEQMQGYVEIPKMEDYIVPCMLEDDAGIIGCLILAQEQITH